MRTPHIITTSATILVALFAAGCSKSPSEPTAQATNVRQVSSLPADMPKRDLGEVELTAQNQKRVSLGDGKACVITPTVLADGNLQMDLSIERTGDDGKIQRLAQSRLTARPGQQCAISVGDTMVSLTPRLKTQ
jgi:Flp pilus assembly secretin CpaC